MGTVLQILQRAAQEQGLPVPSSIVGSTVNSTIQLTNNFYATGRELREQKWWPPLKKKWTIRMNSGQDKYPLPQDFFAAIPETNWDRNNRWQMLGPMSDSMWNLRLYGYITLQNRKAFRVFGPDINPNSGGGQFEINPTPGDGEQGLQLTFEYLSQSWLTPQLWTAGTSYGANVYVSCYGNVYQKGSGTANAGTVPPNMANGVGRDGGVSWLALPSISAWQSSTVYPAGRYVTNGGNLYYCTSGGVSASSGGPSGTDESITDGSVTWQYTEVQSWTGQTDYDQGDTILISAQYYVAQNGGKTGQTAPTWSETTVSDGTITWTQVKTPYDTILADTDLCLFEDELMILGVKWRYLQAKGLGYQDLFSEYQALKSASVARYQPGALISMAGGGYLPAGLNPNYPIGNFTF